MLVLKQAGEERFSVERDENDQVWYEIFSFSKPAHILSVIGYPYVRLRQKYFAQQSTQAVLKHVANRHSESWSTLLINLACVSSIPQTSSTDSFISGGGARQGTLYVKSGVKNKQCFLVNLKKYKTLHAYLLLPTDLLYPTFLAYDDRISFFVALLRISSRLTK